MIEQKKLIKHPSFGYATTAEIEKLNSIGVGPERDQIMKAIATRTKSAKAKKKR